MDLTGRIVNGTYRLLLRQDATSAGDVYLALSLKSDDVVDVTLLPRPSSDPEEEERFLRESKSLEALDSRHILSIEDSGETDGRAFRVTEHVTGYNLGDVLGAQGRLSAPLAMGIGRQLGRAAIDLSNAGIVHQDIRPTNILITKDGVVKILSCRNAVSLRSREANDLGIGSVGEPAYLAPEQLDGRCDIRTDVYSIGVTMYRMLSGQVPFSGRDSVEIALVIAKTEPSSLCEYLASIPEDVDDLVLKCMKKRAESRFQTPAELIAAIDLIPDVSDEYSIASNVAQLQGRILSRASDDGKRRSSPATAYLTTETGQRLLIRGHQVQVGRTDARKGIHPAIDLSPFDPQQGVSRAHASFHCEDGQWYLTESPGVPNGTWVNHQPLRESVPHRLSHGDHVRLAEVKLTFELT